MSLEQAIAENTAALTRVAELLEISNADRAKLLASSGAAPTPAPTPSASTSETEMSVADIKAAAEKADKATLEQMLADETGGKNRATAVKAIETALAKFAEGKADGPTNTPDAATTEATTAGTSASTASAATDKNAQPVPAEVSADQAKSAFGGWFAETDDEDERANRRAFVEQIVKALGAKVGDLDLAGRRKAIFFLRRKRAGMDVDFSANFDFDGSPTQEVAAQPAAAASADDDLL